MDYGVYCGVDFHARQQTICCLTTEDGVIATYELKHDNKEVVRNFYAQLPSPALVGLEAGGYSLWFEQLLEALGHEIWLGDATEIRLCARRRQKNDRRDAALILMHKQAGTFILTALIVTMWSATAADVGSTAQLTALLLFERMLRANPITSRMNVRLIQ